MKDLQAVQLQSRVHCGVKMKEEQIDNTHTQEGVSHSRQPVEQVQGE
jgi:hypothetical protein